MSHQLWIIIYEYHYLKWRTALFYIPNFVPVQSIRNNKVWHLACLITISFYLNHNFSWVLSDLVPSYWIFNSLISKIELLENSSYCTLPPFYHHFTTFCHILPHFTTFYHMVNRLNQWESYLRAWLAEEFVLRSDSDLFRWL